ncbi:MAG: succinate dehydrogenase [Nitrospinae bacterium CG11_big_fil_rev_8_21_14_0_20_56_8]|nr:MAG: succinate dehydrogenase [Nitrospinae bacterium CG11_big_fil_rev_8_21_14_0_20_56_8]
MTTFRIKRFNPEKQPEPYYEEFQMEIPSGATLLDCMNQIKWNLDGSLTYRMSCRSAICGSCAVKVNGHAVLACQKQADSLVREGAVLLEPLGNMRPIKDLAVDFTPFWDKIDKVKPYLQPNEEVPEKERKQSPEQFRRIDHSSTCIMCGACYSDCNVLEVDDNFLGPAALAKAQRFVEDSRDEKTLERVRDLSEYGGIWDCTHCAECVERCPKPARPFDRIKEIMTVALEHGVTNNNGARHALSFAKSVKHSGRLNENTLPVESMGYFNVKGILELVPVGLRMLLKRKIPPIIHKSIDQVDDVKRIFKELDQ